MKRIKNLKEINFGYSLFSHNEVKLCNHYENSTFQLSLEKGNEFVEDTIDELANILTTFATFYIVEIYYQRSTANNLP